MTAYVISEVEPRDAALFARYRALAPATIERYGGRYIVRGGEADVVEGGPPARDPRDRGVSQHGAGARMVSIARICGGAEGARRCAGAAADLR